jgi:hypothetical protein
LDAKDADQYEKWLTEETLILLREFKIAEIYGEMKIQANVAMERVKGEIEMLCMRSKSD